MGIGTLDQSQLFIGAFGDNEHIAAGNVRAQKTGDTITIRNTFSDFHQFDQIPEIEDGARKRRFAPDFLASLLPLTETRHAGDQAGTVSLPKRPELQFRAPSYEFVNQGAFT